MENNVGQTRSSRNRSVRVYRVIDPGTLSVHMRRVGTYRDCELPTTLNACWDFRQYPRTLDGFIPTHNAHPTRKTALMSR